MDAGTADSGAPTAAASNRAAGPTVIETRPPPGLAQGKYPAPPWVIGLIGGAFIAVALIYFAVRFKRHRSR